ncbi:hypothetical protein QBC37DRAFT_476912 [Rhypophila decipiens]|uniref:Uncharacterized protein n=1 Tax=Rhypophila decipiens TaxID=261697 RepID=A0AAN6XZJ5_9PEZI|nr:hypothetical protein QBC37DRAFT_476912 [Rhypophila decipiens]
MSLKRTYFLAPTRDFPPGTNGPIALGNLIKSPRSPEFPLNNPSSPTILKLAKEAHITTETDATRSFSNSVTIRPSVWASFLSSVGMTFGQNGAPVGGGIDYTISKTETGEFVLPKLETRRIFPSMADIRAIFEEEDVQRAISDSRFRSNLYIITAIQIATEGAEYVLRKVRERGGNLHVMADWGTAAGIPGGQATAGSGIEGSIKREDRAGGKVQEPFIFAYALQEVVYRRKKVVDRGACRVQGNLMGHDLDDVKEERVVADEGYEAELAGLKEEDPDMPEYWDLDVQGEVMDLDGGLCQIVSVDTEDFDSD